MSPNEGVVERWDGWLFLDPEAVPERWRSRGRLVFMVPLLPGESIRVLADEPAISGLDPDDERLVRLLVGGTSIQVMAEEMGVSPRTVRRRIDGFVARFGLESRAELVPWLARRGFY